MQTSSSAYRTCSASRSASECTATVFRPISLQAEMMRRAISPRLAMRTFDIGMTVGYCSSVPGFGKCLGRPQSCRGPASAGRPQARTSDLDGKQRFPVFDGLSVLRIDLGDHALHVRFDLVHQLHRLDDAEDLPLRDPVAYLHERLRLGIRRAVERADDRRGDDVLAGVFQ